MPHPGLDLLYFIALRSNIPILFNKPIISESAYKIRIYFVSLLVYYCKIK